MIYDNSNLSAAAGSTTCATNECEVDGPSRVSSNGRAQALLFMVPPSDIREFAERIPFDEQKEVRLLLARLKQIHAAPKKAREIRRIALALKAQQRRGYSASSLERKYYAYVKSGDWRDVVDSTKAPAARDGLPAKLAPFFQKLCEENQRVCSGGIRALLEIWRTHHDAKGNLVKAIPGYDEWPAADPRTGVPAGWTDRNLYRLVPDKFALTLGRQGRGAASAFRLQVFKSRVGLRVGEIMQFDDHEYDLKIKYPGQWRVWRPRGFTALDVLSSCPIAKSFKPTLYDEVEEKKRALTEKDFMWFMIHVLCDIGYRTDERGTTMNVEWGTAAVRGPFEERIIAATNGQVRITRSGKFYAEEMGSRLSVESQMRGQAKGNFRFKALVESFWRSINDYLAHLPGQVGKDRNASPEQLYGQELHHNKLAKIAGVLPVELASQLKSSFLTWEQFLDFASKAYYAIANTDKHEIRGWERCGFVLNEWRLNEVSDWLAQDRLLALPDAERSLALALIDQKPGLLRRARRFSRQEAFDSGRGELTRLPLCHLPTLLGPENALRGGEPMGVSNGIFEFEDWQMGPDSFRFLAIDEQGERLKDKYVCFVNPFNPAALVACDAKLRVVAICPRMEEPCANDQAGLERSMGQARKWEAKEVAEFNSRHKDDIKELQAMHEHNARVLAGAKVAERPAPAVVADSTADLLARENEPLPEEESY